MIDTIPSEKPSSKETSFSVRKIVLTRPVFEQNNRFSNSAQTELGHIVGSPIRELSFLGTTTDAYTNDRRTDVYRILKQESPPVVSQFHHQVEFYTKYSDNPLFKAIAVPMTSVIEDAKGDIIGTQMPFFGMSLEQYKAMGGKVKQEQIDTFVTKYAQFIQQTGIPHGDFAFQSNPDGSMPANWDSVRVDANGNLRFIDYNGRDRGIAYGTDTVYPAESVNTPSEQINQQIYDILLRSEAQRTRQALYQHFAIDQQQSVTDQEQIAENQHTSRLAQVRRMLKRYF